MLCITQNWDSFLFFENGGVVGRIRSFLGIKGKHFKDPRMKDCGMAWFICAEIEASPGCPTSHLPLSRHGKGPTVSSARLRQKTVSRVSAPYYSALQHPANLAFVSSFCPFQAPFWSLHVELHGYGPQGCLGHMTIERRHMNAQGDCESPGREREGERECTYLFPWDYISFGVGWTRWFFKMTIELPSFWGPTL